MVFLTVNLRDFGHSDKYGKKPARTGQTLWRNNFPENICVAVTLAK